MMHRSSDWCTLRQISGFGLMKMPLRWFLFAVVTFLVGVTIGLVVAAEGLERFLEPILVYLFPEPPVHSLVPVDFNPFPDELDI